MSTKKPDWEKIAMALGQRVNFAITHLKADGSGVIGNLSKPSAEWQHWRDYMADAMEMIPGIKVDRELMHLNGLPRNKRRKAIADLKKSREAAGG